MTTGSILVLQDVAAGGSSRKIHMQGASLSLYHGHLLPNKKAW